MFDIGWTEMMVIAVLAIIVIGPKDLPGMLRTIGKWTGRARALAREFQSSLDEVAREAELDEIKKGRRKGHLVRHQGRNRKFDRPERNPGRRLRLRREGKN